MRLKYLFVIPFLVVACAGPVATSTPLPTETATSQEIPTAAATESTANIPNTGGDDVRTYKIIPEESTVSYSVSEILINKDNKLNVAVGTTNAITGQVQLNFTHPEQSSVGTINVDISTLKSDSGKRDQTIQQRFLESAKFPNAKFTPTEIKGISATAKEGDSINFQVTGDLLIRDTTRPTTFEVTSQLQGDTLTGTAQTTIKMSDFNFQAPDIAGILKADDETKLEFKFVARP